MNISNGVIKDKRVVAIKIVYQIQDYQEIRKERDYGIDSLWSNIGGFLGIFIGYSLLNLFNDGYALITYLLGICYSSRKSGRVIQVESVSTIETVNNTT